jgi:hypothetical protein
MIMHVLYFIRMMKALIKYVNGWRLKKYTQYATERRWTSHPSFHADGSLSTAKAKNAD